MINEVSNQVCFFCSTSFAPDQLRNALTATKAVRLFIA